MFDTCFERSHAPNTATAEGALKELREAFPERYVTITFAPHQARDDKDALVIYIPSVGTVVEHLEKWRQLHK